jgi:hypothetical protein
MEPVDSPEDGVHGHVSYITPFCEMNCAVPREDPEQVTMFGEKAMYLPASQVSHTVLASVDEYLPASQSMQAKAPVDATYLPTAQLEQTVEPAADSYLPAPQPAQVEAALAPTAAEKVPAVQLVQTLEALPAEYLPAPQSVQTSEELAEYLPAGQSAHTVDVSWRFHRAVKPRSVVASESDVKVNLRKPVVEVNTSSGPLGTFL